jgi:hypothetical protein
MNRACGAPRTKRNASRRGANECPLRITPEIPERDVFRDIHRPHEVVSAWATRPPTLLRGRIVGSMGQQFERGHVSAAAMVKPPARLRRADISGARPHAARDIVSACASVASRVLKRARDSW